MINTNIFDRTTYQLPKDTPAKIILGDKILEPVVIRKFAITQRFQIMVDQKTDKEVYHEIPGTLSLSGEVSLFEFPDWFPSDKTLLETHWDLEAYPVVGKKCLIKNCMAFSATLTMSCEPAVILFLAEKKEFLEVELSTLESSYLATLYRLNKAEENIKCERNKILQTLNGEALDMAKTIVLGQESRYEYIREATAKIIEWCKTLENLQS